MIDLPIRHILFPYDFSKQARLTAQYVTAFAKRFDARVTVLSVAPPGYTSEQSAEWKRALKCRLDRALVGEFADVKVELEADCGDAALRIEAFAHNYDVDLVMMPTHGLGGFRMLLAGSVTSNVLHDVRCPIWTAAHADSQHAPALPRSILCAVDATHEGVPLLQYAALFSKRVGATLSVLHVVEPVSDWPSLARERALQEEVRDTATIAVEAMLASAGMAAGSRVVVGEIVERAAEAAREEKADLVVLGRGAVREPFARLRAHSFGIIERSPCPVLSV
jgi:nucleotide-binding universal stress UspA family protein